MLVTLQTSAPVTAVLAGILSDDLRLGATPALQQLHQPFLPDPQVVQLQKPAGTAVMAHQQHEPQEQADHQQQVQLQSSHDQRQAQIQSDSQAKVTTPEPHALCADNSGRASPVGPAPRAGYSTDSYWDNRYAEKSTHFDWFYNYSALAYLIRTTCSTYGPCLHVGCGNSGLSEGMAHDGYQVVNVDISAVVIEQMRHMHTAPGQKWEVADCRSMPQYDDKSFASVLDKGTLDAVLCSSHGQADTVDYMNEVHRLLQPGGVFLLISLGQPHARLAALNVPLAAASSSAGSSPRGSPCTRSNSSHLQPYLSETYKQAHAAAAAALAAASGKAVACYNWSWESVEIYLLPKPSLYLASERSLAGKPVMRHAPHTDKDQPVAWLGPLRPDDGSLDEAIADKGLDLGEYFTAFACKKRGGEPQEANVSAAAEAPVGCVDVEEKV